MLFYRDGKVLVSMPGVPFETVQMFESSVFPKLLSKFHSDVAIGHRTLIVADMTESVVAMSLDQWESELPEYLHLAYLPKPGIIRLRIDGVHRDKALLEKELDSHHRQLCEKFAANLLCDSDLTAEEALMEALRARKLTFASAESCTGGNIAHRVTEVAGCSDVYVGSVVSYSNDVKIGLLGVDSQAISTYGAVSEEVARQMVEGVARATGAECAVATSGIAGPTGGSDEKPVGTVCMAFKTPKGVITDTYHFPGSRDRVIDRASTTALTRLAMLLKQNGE